MINAPASINRVQLRLVGEWVSRRGTSLWSGSMDGDMPDRDLIGKLIKRVCAECHAARLRGDMANIMKRKTKKEG